MSDPMERKFRSTRQWRDIELTVKATEDTCFICNGFVDVNEPRFVKVDGKFIVDPRTGKRKVNPLSPQIEHVIPIARGGNPLDRKNCRLAHAICNNRKGDKLMHELDASLIQNPNLKRNPKQHKRRRRWDD